MNQSIGAGHAMSRRRLLRRATLGGTAIAAASLLPAEAASLFPGQSASAATGSPGIGQVSGVDVAVDTSHATKDVAVQLLKFFQHKSDRDVDGTMSYFSRQPLTYIDATLGWSWYTWEALRKSLSEFMPNWPADGRSYPVRILGDLTSALVFFTDTAGLFGPAEIRAVGAVNFRRGLIARQVDYWDGRHFGIANLAGKQEPANQFPSDFGESTVGETAAPAMRRVARDLAQALRKGDGAAAAELFSPAAVFEDVPAHIQIVGPGSIGNYLTSAASLLPYAGPGTSVRHVLGSDVGGGYEWTAADSPVPRGVIALALDRWHKITRLTTMWDGSLVGDSTLTSLAQKAVER